MTKLLFIYKQPAILKPVINVLNRSFPGIQPVGYCRDISTANDMIEKLEPDIIIFAAYDFQGESTDLFLYLKRRNIETIYVVDKNKFDPLRDNGLISCFINYPLVSNEIFRSFNHSLNSLKAKNIKAEEIIACEDRFKCSAINCIWKGYKNKGNWNKKTLISHVISHRNDLTIYSDDCTSFKRYKKMDWMIEQLKDYGFISTGKSNLVCLDKIDGFYFGDDNYVMMLNGLPVNIARDYVAFIKGLSD